MVNNLESINKGNKSVTQEITIKVPKGYKYVIMGTEKVPSKYHMIHYEAMKDLENMMF